MYTNFAFQWENLVVKFIKTSQVIEWVECDVYEFIGDESKDLWIIRIQAWFATPKQRILKWEKTYEWWMSGRWKFLVNDVEYNIEEENVFTVWVGDIVQWVADTDMVCYEVCYPPYEDGRFENL